MHLQSTMVRLRPALRSIVSIELNNLQSTMVRLRRQNGEMLFVLHTFTIHYGEIKTPLKLRNREHLATFTIHYGEIKTACVPWGVVILSHLQSTMVRLRRNYFTVFIPVYKNLQSTMVRLRLALCLFQK